MNSGIYVIRHTSGRCYVGASTNIKDRWKLHRSHLRRGLHHSKAMQADWDAGTADQFIFEVLEALDGTDRAAMLAREQHWIDTLCAAKDGYNTFAMASGRGHQWSADTIEKRAAALRGKKMPAHWVEARRKPRGPMSEEQKAKLSAALKGRKRDPALVEKTAAALRGRTRPAEVVEKVRQSSLGKFVSTETRAKQSVAQKARFARERASTT